jgi:hypothetical protein
MSDKLCPLFFFEDVGMTSQCLRAKCAWWAPEEEPEPTSEPPVLSTQWGGTMVCGHCVVHDWGKR